MYRIKICRIQRDSNSYRRSRRRPAFVDSPHDHLVTINIWNIIILSIIVVVRSQEKLIRRRRWFFAIFVMQHDPWLIWAYFDVDQCDQIERFLKVLRDNFSKNKPKCLATFLFAAIVKITFFQKPAVVTFWATFGKIGLLFTRTPVTLSRRYMCAYRNRGLML